METIFDYNPTKEELKRFGLLSCDKNFYIENIDMDSALYHLGIVFHMRNEPERGNEYFKRIKNKKMLNVLIKDTP